MSRGDACVSDAVRRREVLAQYRAYSIREGRDIGRCVHLADRTRYEVLALVSRLDSRSRLLVRSMLWWFAIPARQPRTACL